MTKKQTTLPSCGCPNCSCRRSPHCRCHVHNALLALALADFGRMVRRHSTLNRARP